jgi:hypothetical protein
MTVVLSILLLIGVAIFLMLLGVGLVIAFSVLVIGGVFLGILFMIFGNSFIFSGFGMNSHAKKLPQQFNQCLLTSDADVCRTKFTTWTEQEADIVKQLANQVKEDLGSRIENETGGGQFAQNTVNGKTTIEINDETDFQKKKNVREHYVLVQDGKDDLRIKELNWDYGEAAPAATPDP